MSYEKRAKFRHALMRLIDNHQEEFESLAGQEIFQVNNVTKGDKRTTIQVLFSETDGMELALRPIDETETVVR